MVKQKFLFDHWCFIASDSLVCLAIFDENQDDYPLVSLKLCEYKNPPEYSCFIHSFLLHNLFLGDVSYKSVYYIVDV